ncbi:MULTISPECIES: hypothetical protein [Amycolatopsis]|uniref:Uncharacterized protein n=1 Tax=Amycolatopsis dongchuanensis TaxID=1070866 RepID=A0ABP8VR95_9PSEU
MIPALVAGLCDDAAVFPPGNASLPDAVRAYRERAGEWYAGMVGPLVLPADALARLGELLPPDGPRLPVSVTLPGGPAGLPGVLTAAAELPVELRSVEVALPESAFASEIEAPEGLDVYVEVPRDARRAAVLQALSGRYRAKFRTGGVRADLYPDETELAGSIAAVVAAGVPFKATAGLHHAVRNTDPETGFEQHGFLNLLLATDALLTGGTTARARELLSERDGAEVARLVGELDDDRVRATRAAFLSFGTCSIGEPLAELVELGVLREGVPA